MVMVMVVVTINVYIYIRFEYLIVNASNKMGNVKKYICSIRLVSNNSPTNNSLFLSIF